MGRFTGINCANKGISLDFILADDGDIHTYEHRGWGGTGTFRREDLCRFTGWVEEGAARVKVLVWNILWGRDDGGRTLGDRGWGRIGAFAREDFRPFT